MSKISAESPIDDLTYDALTVLQKKAKALDAYSKYVRDARAEEDGELEELFTHMRKQDEDDISALKEILARRLDDDLGYEDEADDDDDEDDDGEVEVEVEPPEDVPAAPPVGTPPRPPRPGESTQRHR